jgi:hypothetical protein
VTDKSSAEVLQYMEADKDHFYVYTRSGVYEYLAVENLLDINDYWDTGNAFYISQYAFSPKEKSKFSAYGITNLYEDSVNSDTIRFVDCKNIETIVCYIKEHYCENAEAVPVDEVNNMTVYRIVAE